MIKKIVISSIYLFFSFGAQAQSPFNEFDPFEIKDLPPGVYKPDHFYLDTPLIELRKTNLPWYIRIKVEDAGLAVKRPQDLLDYFQLLWGGGEVKSSPAVFAFMTIQDNQFVSGQRKFAPANFKDGSAGVGRVIVETVEVFSPTIFYGDKAEFELTYVKLPDGEPETGIVPRILQYAEDSEILGASAIAVAKPFSDALGDIVDILRSDENNVLYQYDARQAEQTFMKEPGFFVLASVKDQEAYEDFRSKAQLTSPSDKTGDLRLTLKDNLTEIDNDEGVSFLVLRVDYLLYRDDFAAQEAYKSQKKKSDDNLIALENALDAYLQAPDAELLQSFKQAFSIFAFQQSRWDTVLRQSNQFTNCEAEYRAVEAWVRHYKSPINRVLTFFEKSESNRRASVSEMAFRIRNNQNLNSRFEDPADENLLRNQSVRNGRAVNMSALEITKECSNNSEAVSSLIRELNGFNAFISDLKFQ